MENSQNRGENRAFLKINITWYYISSHWMVLII